MTKEEARIAEDREHKAYWRRWGSYLSERQWGTVREDYSATGDAWEYFTHDQARSRAYRWGEDGIAGICDNHQRLCFAIALWNEQDSILKERLFGLTGKEGNHGEDVKEYYFYLDNTPTHSYMKYLYKYPQTAFPYTELVAENKQRDRHAPEYELIDTGLFEQNRYFDVVVEYAKAAPEDILIRITITNHSSEAQPIHLLPTLWFRNTWSWNHDEQKPILRLTHSDEKLSIVEANHPILGKRSLYCHGTPELLFTENETNNERLFGVPNSSPYVKDGINNYLIHNQKSAVNPDQIGTKASPHYQLLINPGETEVVKLRLCDTTELIQPFELEFDQTFAQRITEAEEFYTRICPFKISEDERNIQRQAFAGMLWSKQFYYYVVQEWIDGDPAKPVPPSERKQGRNVDWQHLFNEDIISMPDKWEYPWYAAWDLAFHLVPLAMIDPDFAKQQLDRLTREWYMHPNGQIPAYEWAFSDVNPPVHAWAAMRVYQIEKKMYGRCDRQFLERVFQKLLLNFTWWVNRKDVDGNNVFQGGFLGLDNIGVFDRSAPLPGGGHISQADGTSWMGMYCLNLLAIALELAIELPVYEDIASKFFEHFLYIADAINHLGSEQTELWDQTEGFFYDVLHCSSKERQRVKVRSMVGLIPLFAITTIEPETLSKLPNFKRRLEWFIRNRPELKQNVACMETPGVGERRLLSIVNSDKLRRILQKMLDESEFLSEYGIRSISRYHAEHPYILHIDGQEYRVDYEPGESSTAMFGGNSNWRGPIWFPVNYLIIESLQKFHFYLGDKFKIECPTNSGKMLNLWEVAAELSRRQIAIFLKDASGKRPVYNDAEMFQNHPDWSDLILFYEYFHGDHGSGIGASHQTGWTGIVAKLIQQCGEYK